MRRLSTFCAIAIILFSFASCKPSSKLSGCWVPDSDNIVGVLHIEKSTLTLQTVSFDSFGNVSCSSYDSFPFALKRNRAGKGLWDVVNADNNSVVATFSRKSSDTLFTPSFNWLRSVPDSLSTSVDYMLHSDMRWLKGSWTCKSSDEGFSPVYSFVSDESFHAGTVYCSSSAGVAVPGVFYVSDSLVHVSFACLVGSSNFRITPSQTLVDAEGRVLSK